MKIAVLGAGGVGGFLGALLARAGHDVAFLARGSHLAAIRERGLEIRSVQFGTFTVRPSASDDARALGKNELVLVAVKMYDFAGAAAAAAEALATGGLALPIQNGLDAPDLLAAAVGAERTLIGSAQIEAQIAEPGVVAHTIPAHSVVLAELQGPPSDRLRALLTDLQRAEIAAKTVEDGRTALWAKAGLLIPFATLTAAGDCTLGEIWSLPALFDAWELLRNEAVAVAAAAGYDVRAAVAAAESSFANMLPATAGFTSSMNRDFRAGRRTELEWLTGALLARAAKHGVPVPAHAALYGLLRLKAETPASR